MRWVVHTVPGSPSFFKQSSKQVPDFNIQATPQLLSRFKIVRTKAEKCLPVVEYNIQE